jgi:hypothetical protein
LPITPRDAITSLRIENGVITSRATQMVSVPDARVHFVWPWERSPASQVMPLRPRDKLHPVLRRWVVDSLGRQMEFLVTFKDSVPFPEFPALDPTRARTDSVNLARLQQARQTIQVIRARRAAFFATDTSDFASTFSGQILETFWVTPTILVRAPVDGVMAMASRPRVMYIRPRFAGEPPPGGNPPNATASDDIGQGSDLTGVSTQWSAWGSTPSSMIGVLDTGIGPYPFAALGRSAIELCSNCVNGGADCRSWPSGSDPDTADACLNGHGTSTGSILSGKAVPGTRSKGVTQMPLDSYKVYVPGPGTCGLQVDGAAAKRGFQNAIARLDPVIVAEIAADDDSWGDVARQADGAYDSNALVFAANGNAGQVAGTVKSPANARKVIGVGAYVITTQKTAMIESLGPTNPDGRIKPDLQAPTNSEAAAFGELPLFHTYSGTSGATPFAAGAGALLHNMMATPQGIPPGQVYAMMILAGQKSYPFDNTAVTTSSPDHPHGAGHVVLPGNGQLFYGQVFLGENQTHPIPITMLPSTDRLDVAAWWADSVADVSNAVVHMHSSVDVKIYNMGGDLLGGSTHPTSVFQRATFTSGVGPGTWIIGLRTHQMREQLDPNGALVRGQIVYWAAYAHTP